MSDRLLAETLVNAEEQGTEDLRTRVGQIVEKLTLRAVDKNKVFEDVFNLVHDPAVLHRAWLETLQSEGAETPGVDGETAQGIITSPGGVRQFLEGLRTELRSGTYRPQPYRSCRIPKAGGGTRYLGIPTIRDRVVQRAMKNVMEPIFEPMFSDASYGYRPGRDPRIALDAIFAFIASQKSAVWVVKSDIESCFDTLDRRGLMNTIQGRLTDKKFLRLLRLVLNTPVRRDGRTIASDRGIGQGGPLSPLLLNIQLTDIDNKLDGSMGVGWLYARYADDFLMLVSGDRVLATAMLGELARNIGLLGFSMKESKTVISDVDEGFVFLGHALRRVVNDDGRRVEIVPSPENIDAIVEYCRAVVESRPCDVEFLAAFDPAVRSWLQHFDRTPGLVEMVVARSRGATLEEPAPGAEEMEMSQAMDPKGNGKHPREHASSIDAAPALATVPSPTPAWERPRLTHEIIPHLISGTQAYVARYVQMQQSLSYLVEATATLKVELQRVRAERERLESELRLAIQVADPSASKRQVRDRIICNELHRALHDRELDLSARHARASAEAETLRQEVAAMSRFVTLRGQDLESLRVGEGLSTRGVTRVESPSRRRSKRAKK